MLSSSSTRLNSEALISGHTFVTLESMFNKYQVEKGGMNTYYSH